MAEPEKEKKLQYISFGLKPEENPEPGCFLNKYEEYVKGDNEIPMPVWVPELTNKWLPIIKKCSKGFGKSPQNPSTSITKTICDCLKEADNPYWAVVHLVSTIVHTMDSSLARNVLTLFEINQIHKPMKLSVEVKKAAFLVAFHQKDQFVLDIFIKVCKLQENADLFVPFIQIDIRAKRYDDAVRAIRLFELQSHFTVADILLPFYLQNRLDKIEAYMKCNTEQHNWLVFYLDEFCAENTDRSMAEVAASLKIPDLKPSQLSAEVLLEYIEHIVKKYNVPKRFWPNVEKAIARKQAEHMLATNREQASVLLDSVFFQFYESNSIAQEDFANILLDIIGGDTKLQQDVITRRIPHDIRGAAGMALNFMIPTAELPDKVRDCILDGVHQVPSRREQEQRIREEQARRKEWHEPIPYEIWKSGEQICGSQGYTPTKAQYVYFVKDRETFVSKLTAIHQTVTRKLNALGYYSTQTTFNMAIDCKCKPVFNSSAPRLSLLMLAIEKEVLVVDILGMESKLTDQDWEPFIALMSNKYLCKLGYNFFNGCCATLASIPALKDIANINQNVLDLKDLCDGVWNMSPVIFPYCMGRKPKDVFFETYVELCLGVTLDKKNISNWDRRPLRESQEARAVADVQCLLDIHRVLEKINGGREIVNLADFLSNCARNLN